MRNVPCLSSRLIYLSVLIMVLCFSHSFLSVAHAQSQCVPVIRDGFNSNTLEANDDDSTDLVGMGFSINFFGTTYSQLYVNNNGNVTFDESLSSYTPFELSTAGRVIIAPFFADVDTGDAGNPVTYGTGTVNGQSAFGVNWLDVDYYDSSTDHINRNFFQLVLIDRSDIAPGDFDIEFNYQQIQWETGEASDGDEDGRGGDSARVGYSNGSTVNFELPGSAVNGAFLDGGPNALIAGKLNNDCAGRYVFQVRGGNVVDGVKVTTGDFNGDGRSDILLIDATRQLQMYFMNAVSVASQANVGVPLNGTTRVEGIGDTNGDQRADILLRDTNTNILTLWRMNGAGIIGQSMLDGGMPQPEATRGMGDLNGDGRADLVLQNETTGQVSVWFMNGATILGKANIGAADNTQTVQAIGDTNGDKRHDLLLRQGNQLKLWLMNGAGIIGQANVGMALDPSAEVIGLNDLNGDGRADIVIRQGDTVSAWVMNVNGTTIFSQTDLAVPATGLETYGLGDFNGDKRFDLLHRFTDATRALRVWLMNGTAVIRQTNTTVTPPTTTEVVAPR